MARNLARHREGEQRVNAKLLTIVSALTMASILDQPASAQTERWQLRMSGVAASSTSGLGLWSDPRAGVGVGLEYRLSPRIGLELGSLTTEVQRGTLSTEATFRMTPLLARLDVHFTPGRRVDFYGGPVAAYVDVGEVTTRRVIDWPLGNETRETRVRVNDELAWGLALGLDVALGDRGAFLAFGATYLELPLEVSGEPRSDVRLGAFDPLIAHVGYGMRF